MTSDIAKETILERIEYEMGKALDCMLAEGAGHRLKRMAQLNLLLEPGTEDRTMTMEIAVDWYTEGFRTSRESILLEGSRKETGGNRS